MNAKNSNFTSALMTKTKLSIVRCIDEKEKFEALINPASISHNLKIKYTGSSEKNVTPVGKSDQESKFNNYEPETLSFDLVLDGTGVVSVGQQQTADNKQERTVISVTEQMTDLRTKIYDYDGSEHEPSVVLITWNELQFKGRLTAMSIEYTLFKPDGTPLRAKVKLAFVNYIGNEEEAKKANTSSPDLTHHIIVKAGDTLPQLCHKIYKDSAYYTEVARFNNLDNFRNLEPGIEISFPPLR